MNPNDSDASRFKSATTDRRGERDLDLLLIHVARGDNEAFEAVDASLDAERVRRCLDGLTDVQRESITLSYYGGYSYRQVSDLLKVTLGAIKTRIRDGIIRMRDCLGVS